MAADFIKISSDLDEVKKLFKDLGGSGELIDEFAKLAAFNALNLAINNAPVDTGMLQGNINTEPRRDLAKFGIYALKSNADYSPYVEFGTGENVSVPSELKGFAAQFKGSKKIVGQKAQPFLYPSALEGQKSFKRFLLKWIDKKIKSK